MNQMNEQELPNLQGVRDCLIVANENFCLVVPIDGANCGLLDSQNHRIVWALTWQQGPPKQIRYRRWCVCRLSDA